MTAPEGNGVQLQPTAAESERPTPARADESPMLAHALWYAELGLRVFPVHTMVGDPGALRCTCGAPDCARPAKHPCPVGWLTLASAHPDEVRAMWKRWPVSNVGIATGRGGVVVLDVDGAEGVASFAELERLFGAAPLGPIVRTARGRHLYFRAPLGAALGSRVKFRPGLDVRGDGGFVCAPPSRHGLGVDYAFEPGASYGERELPPPEWLIGVLASPVASPVVSVPSAPPSHSHVGETRAGKWADRGLTFECAKVRACAPGSRNHTLNTAAFNVGTLVGGGRLDAGEARARLLDAALACGLSKAEASRTIASGLRAGMEAETRSAPTRDTPEWTNGRGRAAVSGGGNAPEPDGPSDSLTDASAPGAADSGGGASHARPGDGEASSTKPPSTKQRCTKPPPVPRYQLLSKVIEVQLQPIGERIATGFATLDRALRGGFPVSRIVVLSGPPGVGKTGVCVEFGHRWSLQGVACVWLAGDDSASGIITRLGQLAGFARGDLENNGAVGDEARRKFALECRGQPLVVVDPHDDESGRTIEDAARVLEHLAPRGSRVLFVDSLQTVRCAAAEGIDSPRERIDAKLEVLRGVAKRGTLVVTPSEVSRAAYRSQDRSQRIDPLAAAKESGSIEYAADVLLSFSSEQGAGGLIDVAMPKNRLGEKLAFRLRQDSARASFTEIELPAEEAEEDVHDAATRRAAEKRVRDAVLANTRLKSQRDVLAVAKGNRAANARAFRAMELEEEIERVGGFLRLRGHVDGGAHGSE